MSASRIFQTMETHTYGEPTRVIDGSLLALKGKTMQEKRDYLAEHMDYIRTSLIQEPRGHRDMFGALLTQPTMEEADFGVIFMDNTNYLNMCGHSVICVVTALIEGGWVERAAPVTPVVLETPAGLIRAHANIDKNGAISRVSFLNVPGFLHYQDVSVNLPGIGEVTIDIAYAGNYLAFIPAKLLGLRVDITNSRRFKFFGKLFKDAINEQLDIGHPVMPFIRGLDIVSFYSYSTLPGVDFKIVNVYSNAQVDRSPGGTGTTAWLARLYSRGELQLSQDVVIEGFVGGTFSGRVVEEVKVGDHCGIIGEVSGKAYVLGTQTILIDNNDPLKNGFIIE